MTPPHKKRKYRLRTILLVVNLTVLILPLGSIFFFRIYENFLVRQTELELISQAAVISSIYKNQVVHSMFDPDSYGKPLPESPLPPEDEKYTPVLPKLDLSEDPILPPRPDGKEPETESRTDPIVSAIGKNLSPILLDAKMTTLSAIKILDYHGNTVAGQSEIGLSFSQVEEIASALEGKYKSVIRERISDEPPPPIASISRGTSIRVFIAFPVIHNNRLWGVVYISRTPKNILKNLYAQKGKVMLAGVSIIGLTLLLVYFTSRTISRPVYQLIKQTEGASEGNVMAMQPLDDPVTEEMELLSKGFSQMALSLHERSEYIREFATYVSHEFKTPLTAIQGASELLLEHYEEMSPDKRRKFIQNMLHDADRLKLLVARLLELAKAESLTPSNETSNLSDILNKLKSKFASQGLEFEIKSRSDYQLKISAEILETALSNLATNSLQHAATRIELDIKRTDHEVILDMLDNGRGIPSGNRDKVFTPFFTTNRESGGTGLGLRIVQTMIEAHSGKIHLGETQKGTLFTLQFPLV
ncbi:MAG: HAMP domain-containing histidine kinase [Nitrospinota bacterium]|nr:HAMP domain-containing histidine kinase [Nitrospinota bacterium]